MSSAARQIEETRREAAEPSFCYCAALRLAARKLSGAYDAALERVGVNLAQYSLLTSIARRQPVSLTELGRSAGLDRSTIGRNVRVLERMGLARALRGDDDLREVAVTLTPDGAKAVRDGAECWAQSQRDVETRLGPEKARALRALLQEI